MPEPSRASAIEAAKRAVAAHERRMHKGKRPTFRVKRGGKRK